MNPYQKRQGANTMNLTKTAPGFQAKINAIAKVANKAGDDLGGDRHALMETLEQAEAAS